MKKFHLHLISDSTGETVSSVARSVIARFDEVEAEEHMWSLVRTKGQMEKVIEGIRQYPGIVMCTVADEMLQNFLKNECRRLKVPCIPVLNRIIRELSSYLGVEAQAQPGMQYELDEEYFARIDAVHYALAHDDGQSTDNLDEADVVLVGVSRTSKTPTCVYLAYKGINAANVPFVGGIPLPENLFSLKNPCVIGLVINPERLLQIRRSRLASLNEGKETSYVDIDKIKEEILEARKVFSRQKWPVIDVTRKSVEEITANIMQVYTRHLEKQKEAS